MDQRSKAREQKKQAGTKRESVHSEVASVVGNAGKTVMI
jgi:hypothetical protein